MKKIIICMLLCLLTSCAGLSDWAYVLPNGYEMWHVNSENIKILYPNDEQKVLGIPSFIEGFLYDERYVCTRNVVVNVARDISEKQYYILDTEDQKVYGPFSTVDDFETKMFELGVDSNEWYNTSDMPNDGRLYYDGKKPKSHL